MNILKGVVVRTKRQQQQQQGQTTTTTTTATNNDDNDSNNNLISDNEDEDNEKEEEEINSNDDKKEEQVEAQVEEEEEEDLDQLLNDMDIDNDFNLLKSQEFSIDDNDNDNNDKYNNNNNNSEHFPHTEVILQKDGNTVNIQTTMSNDDENDAILKQKWNERLEREEIFSQKYRVTVLEEAELQQLEEQLTPINDNNNNNFIRKTLVGRFLFGGGGNNNNSRSKSRGTTTSTSSSTDNNDDDFTSSNEWKQVVRPIDQHPSVIVKRGYCQLVLLVVDSTSLQEVEDAASKNLDTKENNDQEQQEQQQPFVNNDVVNTNDIKNEEKSKEEEMNHNNNQIDDDNNGDDRNNPSSTTTNIEDCELILLTRGFVLAKKIILQDDNNNSNNNNNKLELHTVLPWSKVKFVQPHYDSGNDHDHDPYSSSNNNTNKHGWSMIIENNNDHSSKETTRTINLISNIGNDWYHAIGTVLLRYYEHAVSSSISHQLGWQYRYIYKPFFTEAIMNCNTMLIINKNNNDETTTLLSTLDEYNGMTPLHYAIRLHHFDAIQFLLQHCNNDNNNNNTTVVECTDEDGHTPMYWALREELTTVCTLLEEYGAKTEKSITLKGELFGKVTETEQLIEEQKAEIERKKQVEIVAAEIKNNIQLMQRRGEQINELGDKATELNQNAQDFASMAKQLKEKSKQQSKWLPF